MRNKVIFVLFAAVVMTAAFSLNVRAYEYEETNDEIVLSGWRDSFNFGALLELFAALTKPPEPQPTPLRPFAPDGSATVTDHVIESDGKEFFTFTTPAGNVFFLIIDHDRPRDNVYFLNAVTEQDLIALTVGATDTGSTNDDVTAIPTPVLPCRCWAVALGLEMATVKAAALESRLHRRLYRPCRSPRR